MRSSLALSLALVLLGGCGRVEGDEVARPTLDGALVEVSFEAATDTTPETEPPPPPPPLPAPACLTPHIDAPVTLVAAGRGDIWSADAAMLPDGRILVVAGVRAPGSTTIEAHSIVVGATGTIERDEVLPLQLGQLDVLEHGSVVLYGYYPGGPQEVRVFRDDTWSPPVVFRGSHPLATETADAVLVVGEGSSFLGAAILRDGVWTGPVSIPRVRPDESFDYLLFAPRPNEFGVLLAEAGGAVSIARVDSSGVVEAGVPSPLTFGNLIGRDDGTLLMSGGEPDGGAGPFRAATWSADGGWSSPRMLPGPDGAAEYAFAGYDWHTSLLHGVDDQVHFVSWVGACASCPLHAVHRLWLGDGWGTEDDLGLGTPKDPNDGRPRVVGNASAMVIGVAREGRYRSRIISADGVVSPIVALPDARFDGEDHDALLLASPLGAWTVAASPRSDVGAATYDIAIEHFHPRTGATTAAAVTGPHPVTYMWSGASHPDGGALVVARSAAGFVEWIAYVDAMGGPPYVERFKVGATSDVGIWPAPERATFLTYVNSSPSSSDLHVRAFGGGKVDKLDVGDATHIATVMTSLTRAVGCGGAVLFKLADTPGSTPSLRLVLVH